MATRYIILYDCLVISFSGDKDRNDKHSGCLQASKVIKVAIVIKSCYSQVQLTDKLFTVGECFWQCWLMLRQVGKAVCGIDKKLDRSSAVTDAKYGLESADFKISA